MKKIYVTPAWVTVELNARNFIMSLSPGGMASISTDEADGDAFAKEANHSSHSVWDNEW